MPGKRPLYLEGNRICDADGVTMQELSPEQRPLALRIAQHRAHARHLRDAPERANLQDVVRAAEQLLDRAAPEALAAAEKRLPAQLAEVERRAVEEMARRGGTQASLDAALEELIPEATAGRIQLTD